MTAWRSSLLTLTLISVVTLGITWMVHRAPVVPEWPQAAAAPCAAQTLQLASELYPRSVRETAEGIILTLPAVLAAQSCQPGTWIVTAASVGIGEIPPVLNIGLNGRTWRSMPVPETQITRIPVAGPTRLSLAFLNQSYSVEIRQVKILRVLLRGQNDCRVTAGRVNPSTGSWHEGSGIGNLFGEGTLTLRTCGAKQAVLRLQGQQFQGKWPQLEFSNDTGPLQRVEVAGNKTVNLDLANSSTLRLQLLNPGSLTKQNSRLQLKAIFLPSAAPTDQP